MTKRSLVPSLLVLAACSTSVACSTASDPAPFDDGSSVDFSTPKAIAVRPDAVKTSQHFADSAIVEDGKVSLADDAENRAILDRLVPGTVFAGNRDSKTADLAQSKNAYGFLRKVVSVAKEGDRVVVTTEPAYLDQFLEEGDLVWSATSPTPSIFEDGASLGTQGLHVQGPGGTSSGSGSVGTDTTLEDTSQSNVKFRPVVKVSNAKVSLGSKFEGELKLRKALGIPYGVKRASAKLDLDPVIGADIEYGVKVLTAQSAQGGSLYKSFESPSVPIPIGGPIPLTIRLRAEINCNVTVTGEVSATSRVGVRGHASAGFRYDGGTDIDVMSDEPTLTVEHQFVGVRAKAGVTGECAVQAVVSLLAFDAAGIEVKVGPYGAVTGEVCATYSNQTAQAGFALYEQHGLRVNAGARLQVPGLGFPSIDKGLFSFKPVKSEPSYFVGSADTCKLTVKDSCAGKVDGVYCSDYEASVAYECKAGGISGGQSCAPPKKCVGPNGAGTTIQCR